MAVATSTAVALALAAAAAGASYYNTRQTAKKQDQALASGIRRQSKVQREADAKIGQELDKIGGSTSADERQTTLQAYNEALRGSEQQAQAGRTLSGLSSEYDAATGAATNKSREYVSGIADLLSRIDAPSLQRQGEGVSAGRLGMDLGVLGRQSQGIDYLARMKAGSVRRNPYIDALAAGLNSYAGGMGTGGATGSTAATTAGGLGGGIYNYGAGFGG